MPRRNPETLYLKIPPQRLCACFENRLFQRRLLPYSSSIISMGTISHSTLPNDSFLFLLGSSAFLANLVTRAQVPSGYSALLNSPSIHRFGHRPVGERLRDLREGLEVQRVWDWCISAGRLEWSSLREVCRCCQADPCTGGHQKGLQVTIPDQDSSGRRLHRRQVHGGNRGNMAGAIRSRPWWSGWRTTFDGGKRWFLYPDIIDDSVNCAARAVCSDQHSTAALMCLWLFSPVVPERCSRAFMTFAIACIRCSRLI